MKSFSMQALGLDGLLRVAALLTFTFAWFASASAEEVLPDPNLSSSPGWSVTIEPAPLPNHTGIFTATGRSVSFALDRPLTTGENLTVIENDGIEWIEGRFENLAQGQKVDLIHNNVRYRFVANYHGGTGNDLVLEWAYTRAFTWGTDQARLYSFASTSQRRFLPWPTRLEEVIPGKTLVAISVGESHALGLCADGTLVSAGSDSYGQLGAERINIDTFGPAIVTHSGALHGKTVIQIAAGANHSMALCSDGTLAAWGINQRGQIGSNDPDFFNINRPKAIDALGALAGKRVVSIAAGSSFSLALCADGTLAAWGNNTRGQLANDSTGFNNLPVAVTPRGALVGKKVIALAAGSEHALVLCNDGTLVTWGVNSYGQLGNNGIFNSNVPVAVIRDGALAGKTIVSIACGRNHNVVFCSDGTIATWGDNSDGQLGDSSYTTRRAPVAINPYGALSGRKVVAVGAMGRASLAIDSNGSLVAWGYNDNGQVGDGSTTYSGKNTPTLANAVNLASGERFLRPGFGSDASCSVALTALPLANDARLSGLETSAGFLDAEFKPETAAYSASIPAGTPSIRVTPRLAEPNARVTVNGLPVVDGSPSPPIALPLADQTIHIRVTAENGSAIRDYSIVLHEDATLSDLRLATGRLDPEFRPRVATQHGYVAPEVSSLAMIPIAASSSAVITINRVPLTSGAASGPWPLAPGDNRFTIEVMTQDGSRMTYQLTVTRQQPLEFTYTSASDVPFAAGSFTAFENRVNLSLGFAPAIGTEFTVIRNSGASWIGGQFSNLAHGQRVVLSHNNANYGFVANYHGGSGNDLVLQWADNRVYTWGSNENMATTPTPIDMTGVLSGKTIVAAAAGPSHRLVLCSDGTLASWGSNSNGQLGNGTKIASNLPVPLTLSGALEGKTVIAIAVGGNHNLALCSDGSLAAWGRNGNGQLGDGSFIERLVPVIVSDSGVLAGRKVAAITAGGSSSGSFSVALCSDGTLASWGTNFSGQLGLGSSVILNRSAVPMAVESTGVMAGKTVSAIAAGGEHTLALCSDGTLVSWGYNSSGQLGGNVSAARGVPVLVNPSGVLFGKSITAIAAGGKHSLALCSDGTLASWGDNSNGQLGNNSTSGSHVPIAVSRSGFLSGKTITRIAAGSAYTMARCSDGTLAAWGHNYFGQLGDGTTTNSRIPIPIPLSSLAAGEKFAFPAPADSAVNTMAVVARPLSNSSELASLALASGTITPDFAVGTAAYISTVPFAMNAVTVIAQTAHPLASVRVNGMAVSWGAASGPVNLLVGENTLTINVTAQDGIAARTYTVTVMRLPQSFVFHSDAFIPLTANGFSTGGLPVNILLNYPPIPGTALTMVNNTGSGFIHGRFGNLAQGQRITLQHDGVDYDFVANYHGGSGNDLVLHWADTAASAWGQNNQGQLGDGTTVDAASPVSVELPEGALAGKTIFAMSAGYLHSLALLHDGSVAAWGYNVQGQLGLGHQNSTHLAALVDRTGALAGKTVIAIAAGALHNLALCDDGTIVAWGMNNHGQLGTGDRGMRVSPVPVEPLGALAGKRVVAISAGFYHSLALCADGTVAAWGYNDEGELGDGTTTTALVPVAVDAGGVLSGKSVSRISAGQYHSLALCADGTLVAWGYNARGQLGDNTFTDRHSPVRVDLTGIAAGGSIQALAAGGSHSLAKWTDGSLAGWGDNARGQLITGGEARIPTPQPLMGTALEIHAGANHSVARRTPQSIHAWGDARAAWSTHDDEDALASPPWIAVSSGPAAFHNLAIIALPGRVGAASAVLAEWRTQHFGTADNEGEAANCHDCDHDGIPNLVEYAFGLDPQRDSSGKIPQPKRVGNRLEMSFSRRAIPNDVLCGVEWSPDLSPGSWSAVPDSGSGDEHHFSLPLVSAPSVFMRIRVRSNVPK